MINKEIIREMIQEELNKPINLDIIYHDKNMPKLEKIDKGNWIDLRVIIGGKKNGIKLTEEDFKDGVLKYKEGDSMMLCLGISLNQPKGYEINIVPRSSTFKNYGLIQTNHYGVGDDTYIGDKDIYYYPCYALRDGEIALYDRVCQMKINKAMPELIINEKDSFGNDSRGGFGSTGIK
ncbi:deoxyuridine 5'-triphosphate nucleotidohydrolase [Clostridium sardiniense]|nr:deoxyuridine 5'-triphosphate nucleotidohydrolase [Clostridium sardiniense]MBM7836173.1 dUTP pyrophosphatase [Clostridium sardiniense]MDQ0461975.1 dUTP pyrophosphatase [Clostridium sardiniense]